MGKKSKSDKPKNKISVQVKQHHIETAHERLRIKFNEKFNSNVEKGNQKVRDLEKEKKESENPSVSLPDREKIDYDEVLENLSNILDFYRDEKIPRTVMLENNEIDPVLLAYNTLCDQGIKRTVSHGQQLQMPGEKFRILFMRAYYGRDNVAEKDEEDGDSNLDERYQEVIKNMAEKLSSNPGQITTPEEAASAMASAMAQTAVAQTSTVEDSGNAAGYAAGYGVVGGSEVTPQNTETLNDTETDDI